MRRARFWVGILLALASASSFGLIPLFASPMISAGMAPETVALYRFGLAAILLYPILPCMGISIKISRKRLLTLALLALCYFADVQFFFYAFQYLASGLVATLEFLSPVMVMAIMIFFFHQKFRWQAALAALLALGGVWLLGGGMDGASLDIEAEAASQLFPSSYVGICLSLLAAFFCALYMAGCEASGIAALHPLLVTFFIMLFGGIYCVMTALLTHGLNLEASWQDIGRGVALALVTAIFSNLTLVMAIKRVGSVLASILGVMEPLTAVFIGVCVFGESLTFWMGVGAFLVIAAALLATLGRS